MRILCRIHREGHKVVTSTKIAEKEGISSGVVLKLLRELSRAGIVNVHRGRGQHGGGFSLARSIDAITMADIIVALEGLDIGVNLKGDSHEKVLEQICDRINGYLMKLLSNYSIRYLLEPDESEGIERQQREVISFNARERDERKKIKLS